MLLSLQANSCVLFLGDVVDPSLLINDQNDKDDDSCIFT